MSSFIRRIQATKAKIFIFFTIGSTALYYLATRWYQDTHPVITPDVLDALPGTIVNPESYEIPLYLLGYAIIPFIAFMLSLWFQPMIRNCSAWISHHEKLAKLIRRMIKYFLLTVVVLVGVFVIVNIAGRFEAVRDYFSRQSVWHLVWLLATKRLYIVRISLLSGVAAFLFLFFVYRPQWFSTERIRGLWESEKVRRFVPYFFIFLALLVFHPNFPSQENFTNYILSPAHETLLGKPLLYDTSSVYGVLTVYFVFLVSRFILPVSYQVFSVIIMIFYFLFFIGLYRVLRQWLQSRVASLLGVWVAVVFGFLLLTAPHISAFDFPGQGAYRHGFYLLTLFLLSESLVRKRTLWRELTFFAAGISLFWSIDTGIYVTIAAFATFAWIELSAFGKPWFERIRGVIAAGMHQFVYAAGVFIAISGINRAIYGSWPNWTLEIRDISTFSDGFARFPIPLFGLFYFHVIVYTLALAWILKQFFQKKSVHPVMVFLTVYGVFSFLYYIGTSAWSYLNFITIPAALLALYGFHEFLKKARGIYSDRFVLSLFGGAISFLLVLSVAKIPTVFAYRNYRELSSSFHRYDADTNLAKDADYIKKHFPDVRLAMFHEDDGKLLLMADKINLFYLQENNTRLYSLYDNYLIVFKRQMQGLKNQVDEMQPKYIFITNAPSDTHVPEFEQFVQGRGYTVETRLKTLNIYKRPL